MVRKEFAEEKPMTVAKILAGWLRAVNFINTETNREEVLDHMANFFAEHNVEISRSALELDLKLVALFELQQQVDLMARRGSPPLSPYDTWTNDVGKFLVENGVLESVPDPTTFIDDKYIQMVKSDKQLENWATGGNLTDASASCLSLCFHYYDFVVPVSLTLYVLSSFM
jgi:hypothetical protein